MLSVPTQTLADALGPLPPAVEVVIWPMDAASPRPRIDLAVAPYTSLRDTLPNLAGVHTQLVQSQSIGYDEVATFLPAGHRFANAATVHETSTAELALTLTLAAQRRIPAFVERQRIGRWAPTFAPSLADRRVLLLGYGGVGKAVAACLAPFEVDLTVVASHARVEDGVIVHGVDALPTLLPAAEVVILTLPGGTATAHILDAAALALLPDRALVVNVGRGSLIDLEALTTEVAAGRLRAALDVTEPEPLPADHPLWQLEGALITPHVGGASSAMAPRISALVRRQLAHLLAGETPENIVIDA